MADLDRSTGNELILRDSKLKRQHYQIILNEKQNQIKQLDVTLDRMKSVEIKKIELTKETLLKEIQALSAELKQMDAVDVTAVNKK